MSVAPKISIALATYNGARYLPEQLQSLAAQHYLPIEIVACDDGSRDETLEVLQAFRGTAPFPVRIYRNEVNLGFSDNFLKAARLCNGEWIAFCDQDDVWLPEKLKNAAEAIEKNEKALLVLQNAILYDAELKAPGRLFPDTLKAGSYGAASQYGFWVWLGFLQTFRASMLKDFSVSNRPINYYPGHAVQSHDKWTCMIANALGGIVVLDKPVALYRRHPDTVTGDYHHQKPSERVAKALCVSSENYRFLANVAGSTVNYFNRAAYEHKSDKLKEISLAAENGFRQIEHIQLLRAQLYSSDNMFSRLCFFLKVLVSGGYWGPHFTAMGGMSAAKDLAAVLRLIGRTAASMHPTDPAL